MGKILTLLGLYGLYAARVIRLKHDAGSIWGIYKRKPASVPLQMAPFIDESHLVHAQVLRNGCNICICQADIALPPATSATALAGMHNLLIFLRHHHISHGLRVAFVICGGRT